MKLAFELDPQIIHHIIYSQAGSIGKALIELLMNSVDAEAKVVQLSMSKDGFRCCDDGKGFASRDDVIRYFGRFGTPHQDGDATYGRFRLGRGQIMAHASTVWNSNLWRMTVDTRAMGYSYELDEIRDGLQGCDILGLWYEPLSDSELMSAIQEVRDLVRYTPISVELNGRLITRDPLSEKWDAEDEFAYYRVKEEGAVSIYNQGVLVRHDPSHIWGAGGLIVSKKAIGLNVSRTEILRKTCEVWKPISKQFGKMAEGMASRLGKHRKTEAARERDARALLSGDGGIAEIHEKAEVITLLPGKRHVSMLAFLRQCNRARQHHSTGQFSVVENGFDIPKGEAIARQGVATIVHPATLERFGCYNALDFVDCIDRINGNLRDDAEVNNTRYWGLGALYVPELLAFATLRDAFMERTQLVTENEALDKETLRAWTSLRWCLEQYVRLCTGGEPGYSGRAVRGKRLLVLLGESNTAEAWTDGSSYVAVSVGVVKRLRTSPMKTASYIFSLIEHEVAHEGDSLDCGHDEAFYQRFHDIALRHSEDRQRYMHTWLMKYTTSMEREGKASSGEAWRERFLVDRVGNGRQRRGLSRAIEDVSSDPVLVGAVPEENLSFIKYQNALLVDAGFCPPPPDWGDVVAKAVTAQAEISGKLREEARARAEELALLEDEDRAIAAECESYELLEFQREEAMRKHAAELLGVPPGAICESALMWFLHATDSDDDVRKAWAEKAWQVDHHLESAEDYEDRLGLGGVSDFAHLPAHLQAKIQPGETSWALERNAAAAGFSGYNGVEDYLTWRTAD